MSVWEIWVPKFLDDKKIVPIFHYEWDLKVMDIAGGLTLRETTKGKWLNQTTNDIGPEEMLVVRIGCTEEQIKEIMEITKEHYKQEAVFAMKISNQAFILE